MRVIDLSRPENRVPVDQQPTPSTAPTPADLAAAMSPEIAAFYRQITTQDSQERAQAVLDAVNRGVHAYWLKQFVTVDSKMAALKSQVATLADNSNLDDPILISGPTGTGKELLARALHGVRGTMRHSSDGRRVPDMSSFYAINCAAIAETLIDSELFGHEKGSFTGAIECRRGILQAAKDGTVFLDEIGELNLQCQAKLLRAIQEREIRPVGSNKSVPISCQFVCATKHDLQKLISQNKFRDDLYGRLMTFAMQTTGLEDRRHDIEPIFLALGGKKEWLPLPEGIKGLTCRFNVRALHTYVRRMQVWGTANPYGKYQTVPVPDTESDSLPTDELILNDELPDELTTNNE